MRERFSGSMIMVAIAAAAAGAVIAASITQTSAQAPAASGTRQPRSAENALGRTRSAGHLDRRDRHAVAAPRQVCEPGIFHRGAAGRIG